MLDIWKGKHLVATYGLLVKQCLEGEDTETATIICNLLTKQGK